MESRAKFLGHSVHQMLVPIPVGLFLVAACLDIVDLFVEASWIPTVTFWNLALGIGAALLAAIFGLADWTKIPAGTRAKRIGTIHGLGNVIAVVLFSGAVWLRAQEAPAGDFATPLVLEVIALVLLGITGWLGGELVDRLGVGVDDGAHLNAPSSLRTKHARTE